jgi:hypothetical protein
LDETLQLHAGKTNDSVFRKTVYSFNIKRVINWFQSPCHLHKGGRQGKFDRLASHVLGFSGGIAIWVIVLFM